MLTGRGEKSNTEEEEEREINNSKNVYPLVLYLRTKSHNQHNFIKKRGVIRASNSKDRRVHDGRAEAVGMKDGTQAGSRENLLSMMPGFRTSNPDPVSYFFIDATSSRPPQSVPPTGN